MIRSRLESPARRRALLHGTVLLAIALAVLTGAGAVLAKTRSTSKSTTSSSTTSTTSSDSYSTGYSTDDNGTFSYALGKGDQYNVNMSGNHWNSLRSASKKYPDQTLFWFSLDGDDYVVHDDATIAKVKEIAGPMWKLGEQQGELGRRQGELGRQQGKIGRLQSKVGSLQAQVSMRLAQLTAAASDGGSVDRQRAELQATMEELSAQQESLSRAMEPLSARQAELGSQQAQLGQEQARLSREALPKLKQLAKDAVAKGTAERVGE